jgi:hypothetical protein
VIVPRCISTTAFAIAKPSPRPPNWRVMRASPCSNASKIARQQVGRDADAAVDHVDAQPAVRLVGRVDGHFAAGGRELRRVAQEVPEDLLQPGAASALGRGRATRGVRSARGCASLVEVGGARLQHVPQHLVDRDGRQVQPQFAAGDAREVEQGRR